MSKFAVIVPAAGKGERFGGGDNKAFAKLDGRPVFLRTVEHFLNRDEVCQILLGVAPGDMDTVRSKYGANLGFMGVKLVEGGVRRCDTIANALKLVSDEAEFVAVHDAARPCVTPDQIGAVFAEALKTGAAILAAPLTGTIKRVSDSMVIDETVPRTSLFEAQTPQVFSKKLLVEAYAKLADLDEEPTDDASLLETSGHPVAVVKSDFANIKITTKADMTLANAILKARPRKPVAKFGAFEEAQW